MNNAAIAIVVVIILVGGYLVLQNPFQSGSSTSENPYQQADSESSHQSDSHADTNADSESGSQTNAQVDVTVTDEAPATHAVSIQGFAFSNTSIHIKKGDTVVWTNKDSAPHTVTGSSGGPASGTLNAGDTYSFTFNNAGTFNYACSFHPSMKGSVVVSQ